LIAVTNTTPTGWGNSTEIKILDEALPVDESPKHRLDSFRSTAISGNDLMASVLYTTGLVCVASGQLAPISMFLCVLSLYPFVKILQECGTAIPLNGGLYVALLNSTNKLVATFAASCSLIDYAATAVVSAASCTSYAAVGFGEFPTIPVTICVLGLFAGLVMFGIKESANVATIIFSIHMLTLIVLIITSLVYVIQDQGQTLMRNWNAPLPISNSGIGMDIYLGYSISLLGLTGFETSANYIEDIGK
jgi:amino acid transporter